MAQNKQLNTADARSRSGTRAEDTAPASPEPAPATPTHMPWYVRESERLRLEQTTMQERFPQFKLYRDGETLFWLGSLAITSGNMYELVVTYPETFPNTPPRAYPVDPPIAALSQHGGLKYQSRDGHLDFYVPGERRDGVVTAAMTVARAVTWLLSYESWVASGKKFWPAIEVDA